MALTTDTTFAATAASQYGAISRPQLRTCGMSREAIRHQVARGALIRITRDLFVVAGAPDTWKLHIWIGLLEAGPGAIASHRTAAALLELPGFPQGPIDVTLRERRNHRVRRSSLHLTSWLPDHHLITVDGIPTSSLARCIFELAGLSSPQRLRRGWPYVHELKVERTYDNATQRGLTYSIQAEVLATLGKRGRPGTQLMRRILDERAEGFHCTESELEDLVLAVIVAHGLPAPEKQRVLGDELPVGRVDFVYLRERVIIEADSRKHHTALLDRRSDGTRDLRLTAAGFRTIRVSYWDLVHQPWEFIAALKTALAG